MVRENPVNSSHDTSVHFWLPTWSGRAPSSGLESPLAFFFRFFFFFALFDIFPSPSHLAVSATRAEQSSDPSDNSSFGEPFSSASFALDKYSETTCPRSNESAIISDYIETASHSRRLIRSLLNSTGLFEPCKNVTQVEFGSGKARVFLVLRRAFRRSPR